MTVWRVVILFWILAAFIGLALGALDAPGWMDILIAFAMALAGTRWIQILRRGVQ